MAYDPSLFEARRRGYTENYAAQAAANQYSRTLSQQRGARQRQDALRQYERAQPQLVRAYSQRNLVSPNVRSGIFSRAMQEFAGERARGLSDFDMSQAEQMRGFDLEDARLLQQYRQMLGDLEADKAREIADAARQLFAFRAGAM
jgi:hypothetical protein